MSDPDRSGVGRRAWLGAALAAGTAGCTRESGASATGHAASSTAVHPDEPVVLAAESVAPFRAARQPGIRGRVQPYAAFVAFDLVDGADRGVLERLLRIWSDDIDRLMSGRAPLTDPEPELARHPAGLTVTVGVGPRAVRLARDKAAVPHWLGPLPSYPIDRLEKKWCDGDLVLQLCADSPTTLTHAARRLTVGVPDLATVRWTQRGFREPLDTGEHLVGMRNLFGQVDGTINPSDDTLVFVGEGGPEWLVDGSVLVLRRIAMNLQKWERVDRSSRENVIGRRLGTGGPITGGTETDPANLGAKDALGFPVIDDAAHMRRAHATTPREMFLRRPYSYDDGMAPGSDAGLLFAAFMADPVEQFLPVQQRLAEKDLLNLWTTPIGSALFAILPGIGSDPILGAELLA